MKPMFPTGPDLTRNLLVIVLLIVLVGGSLWVLRPFIPAIVWATMIVVSTWPVMRASRSTACGAAGSRCRS